MKLIKMKIIRNRTPEKTSYLYPAGYDAKKVRFGPIYESSLPENFQGVVDRGDTDEFILIGVNDTDAPQFLANADAEEVNHGKALELGNKWTKQVEHIDDPETVIALCKKVARDEPLTKEEKDALDPDKLSKGISKSKSFKDALDEAVAE